MKEFQTTHKIISILQELGVLKSWITNYKPTGLTVTIRGQADPVGKDMCVAFRADIDALSMNQDNQKLQYKSKNIGAAHACGHDGHLTCLVGFVPLYLEKVKEIPKNKIIKLIFQPSEEGPESGAKLMIEQGCLDQVDQIYGFHSRPVAQAGILWCKQGVVHSESTIVSIKIIGTGGHGSEPQSLKVAVWKGVEFYQKIKQFIEDLKKKNKKQFVCTFPVFKTGERFNVISEEVFIAGTIRSFEEGFKDIIINKISQELQNLKKEGFQYSLEFQSIPMNINTKKEAENIIRVGKRFFGENKVGPGLLPSKGSEDFSYYTQVKLGAYFFLCSKKGEEEEPYLHSSKFNFNDDLIELASRFWLELALDRVFEE